MAFGGGGGPVASPTGPPTDTFGAGPTVSSMALLKLADLTRLIQEVMGQMNPMGVAQQAAEDAARRVSPQNGAR